MDDNYRAPALPGDRIRASLALQVIAAVTGIPAERMNTRTRLQGRECKARWMAMYLAHVTYDWPVERVGLAFGLNRTTAAKACRWGEDERDEPLVDILMERLERFVRDVLEVPACELKA
ncbi:MAG: chromosomal replication initiator DnaA [Brevundimonas sp.]|uniref:chromosomal replication initiator DnaA n=1 Tax=Brevundimonas sp. TaxID=1871086 RepID=UPI00403409F7